MPRKKEETPALPTKKTAAVKAAAKRPVGRPRKDTSAAAATAAPKRRGRPPKAAAVKTPVKKAVPPVKTSSLVNAKPLSSVSPTQPEQLIYESDVLQEPIRPPKQPEPQETLPAMQAAPDQAAAEVPKRRPGRPKAVKNEAAAPQPVSEASARRHSEPAVPPSADNLKAAKVVSEAPSAVRQRRRNRVRRLSLLAAAVVLLVAGWYFTIFRKPDVAAANNQLITEVSKRAVLPTDETPSISTVVDTTKVNQEFLKNAQKGDKVLLYFQSGQAIVYRPSTGQIVNMGPLETPKPRVFIRQGSNINNVGLVRNDIAKTSDFMLASQDQSANKSYTQTVVVDLTGNRPDLAGKLGQLLHVPVAQLPAGEDRPDADLMVIVGSDFK